MAILRRCDHKGSKYCPFKDSGSKKEGQYMVGCQNYCPLLGPLNNTRCRTIIRSPKRDHDFDNHPYGPFGYNLAIRASAAHQPLPEYGLASACNFASEIPALSPCVLSPDSTPDPKEIDGAPLKGT